jgi:hypothetical protein
MSPKNQPPKTQGQPGQNQTTPPANLPLENQTQGQPGPPPVDNPPPAAQAAPAAYVVTTDRRPFWGGKPRPWGFVILNPQADPGAIRAMLERGWIEEKPYVPTA